MNKSKIKTFVTHIHTLSDNNPKSRRRVRKILGLANDAPMTLDNVNQAVVKATAAELKHNAPKGKKR